MAPPAPPVVADTGPEQQFVHCRVDAAFGRGSRDRGVQQGDIWRMDYETWLFREAYVDDFSVLLRKMGYHLPMIYRNVSITCSEATLGEVMREYCKDCIRHLTQDAYGELGMIVPAHPDKAVRGRRDAESILAFSCLVEGKTYGSSPLFCRSREREKVAASSP